MTTTLNQHRNTINRNFERPGLKFADGIEILVKAKRCWNEATAASEEAQTSKQVELARRAMKKLRDAVEERLKQLGWGWDELEERAERAIDNSGSNVMAQRLTYEEGMSMDMGEM